VPARRSGKSIRPNRFERGLKPIIHYVVEESGERAAEVSAHSYPGL
jgi:hypothetical protein